MRLHMSLRTRFFVSFIVLEVVLLGTILLAIENREVRAINEEQREKGVLIAKNIAQMNINLLAAYDEQAVQENIDNQIDEKLIYVVIYYQFDSPFANTEFLNDYQEIRDNAELRGSKGINENSFFMASKKLKDHRTGEMLPIMEIEVPIFYKGSPTKYGSVKVGISMEEIREEISQTRMMLVLIGVGGLLVGSLGARLLARRITTPLHKLVNATVNISKGDFSQKIDIHSRDEIGELARSFDNMSRQLLRSRKRVEAANRKLIQAEKLASIGRISAGIAHEIRNPLTSVKLNIQKIVEGEEMNGIERDHLEIAQEGIIQIENFIKEMLNYTRVSELNKDYFSIIHIVDESVKMVSHSMELKHIRLQKTFEDNLPMIRVDADKIRQVLVNLLRNAAEAVDESGEIRVDVDAVYSYPGGAVRIYITDNGCGIPKKDWENIFEPYFTTKPSGFGLGLANARKIIEQHGGTITVKKPKDPGITFEIILPSKGEK